MSVYFFRITHPRLRPPWSRCCTPPPSDRRLWGRPTWCSSSPPCWPSRCPWFQSQSCCASNPLWRKWSHNPFLNYKLFVLKWFLFSQYGIFIPRPNLHSITRAMLKILGNSNRKLKSKQIIHIYVKEVIFLTWVFEGFGGDGASHGDRAQSGPGVLKQKLSSFILLINYHS